jgi:hypothetical protein
MKFAFGMKAHSVWAALVVLGTEGVLFRDALARAATACGVRLLGIPDASLAAMIALQNPAPLEAT